MKKLFVMILTLLTCRAAYPLPVGNPSDASLLCDGWIFEGNCGDPCDPCLNWCNAFSFRLGFYGDYVFNRHLEVNTTDDHSNIEKTQIDTNAAFIAANLWDRFDLFTTLGATNLAFDTNAFAFTGVTTGTRLELQTETSFSWSIGGRATIWECGCTNLGIEGAYFSTKPNVSRVTAASLISNYPDASVEAQYREWQVGAGLSHRIHIFVPYVALKWSRAKLDFDQSQVSLIDSTATLLNLKNDKNWGWAVGVSMVDCEKASVTVEGRFGDEKALHVNGQIRF